MPKITYAILMHFDIRPLIVGLLVIGVGGLVVAAAIWGLVLLGIHISIHWH